MLLRNSALTTHPYLVSEPVGPEAWQRFILSLNEQTVTAAAVSGSIEPLGALPALPNTSYPVGAVVYYTVDGKLYRNVANAWTKAVDGGDITANSILANSIGAGQVTAAKITVDGGIAVGSGGNIHSGQSAYDTGTGYWLEYNSGTPRLSIGNASGNKLTWNGTVLAITGAITATSGSFTGGITVGSGGTLSSGQSAYDTGTGYWLEYNSGTPRFSLGTASGNKLTWDGTTLSIVGDFHTGSNIPASTTPTFTGFSSDPTLSMSTIQVGPVAVLYVVTAGSLTGTSNSTSFSFTTSASIGNGLFSMRSCVFTAIDNGNDIPAYIEISSGGTVTMYAFNGTTFSATGWTNSGTKGFKLAMPIIYMRPSWVWA